MAGNIEDLFMDRLEMVNVTDSSVTDTFNLLANKVESFYWIKIKLQQKEIQINIISMSFYSNIKFIQMSKLHMDN